MTNLTTAASIWFSGSIGMAIGFGEYGMAILAVAYSVLVPRTMSYFGRNHAAKEKLSTGTPSVK